MAKMRLDMRVNPKLHKRQNNGSALLLVVVVTMLLSVIGIVFIMTARLRGIAASGVTDSRDLDAAVQSVVSRVDTVLLQDLFGKSLNKSIIDGTDPNNEPYDSPAADTWLASLEPSIGIDGFGQPVFYWQQVTDLFNNNFGVAASGFYDPQHDTDPTDWNGSKPELEVRTTGVLTKIITPGERVYVIKKNAADWSAANLWYAGARADADGDGVADSRWVIVPNLTTGGGKPVYAAVRIIDNCAMLNLNTAYCFYQDPYTTNATSPFLKSWFINKAARTIASYPSGSYYADGGRYLSEINYLPFLRGSDLNSIWGGTLGDGWYRILSAKGFCVIKSSDPYDLTGQLSTGEAHQILMNIENPGSSYSLFDLGDELEIRNRFLLTSKVESRFERSDVANYTLDAGGGVYAVFETPVDDSTAFTAWKIKMNPANFDLWSGGIGSDAYKYDRRHLCTFYSFDRNIRTVQTDFYTFLDTQPESTRYVFVPKKKAAVTTNIQNLAAAQPYNNTETRRKILHLLYAFREYFYSKYVAGGDSVSTALVKAARQSAQIMANMIDYTDDDTTATAGPFANTEYGSQVNANPTYITRAIVRQMILEASGNTIDIGATASSPLSPYEFGLGLSDTTTPPFETVYGYERQPFISEVYSYCDNDNGGVKVFALELINPYQDTFSLKGWNICFGAGAAYSYDLGSNYVIPAAGGPTAPGRLTIYTVDTAYSGYAAYIPTITTKTTTPSNAYSDSYPPVPFSGVSPSAMGLGMQLNSGVLCLRRPDPANPGKFLTVDKITDAQRNLLITDMAGGTGTQHDTSRKDTDWGFTNNLAYMGSPAATDVPASFFSLGDKTKVSQFIAQKGYALPVANDGLPIGRLADFESVAFIGNQNSGTDPNTITKLVSEVSNEAGVRFNMATASNMLGYICTLNRDKGNLPGRININTAPKHVIAAAIPPNLVMSSATDPNVLYIAGQIVANRPYTSLADLLTKVPAIKKFVNNNPVIVGDTSMSSDFEKRDWILSRLSNIFTVRSDTFTAYILVRLGADGPQRRMIAIFDRSNVWSSTDKPKLVALHPVSDPR
jgi:hypothetical protein